VLPLPTQKAFCEAIINSLSHCEEAVENFILERIMQRIIGADDITFD
jgi:hypothetical protein